MLKCFFVDVKSISSEIPRSEFDQSKIEQLADLILATDGLIRPLILRQSGLEKYTVVDGNLEYYAAVRAKEKNLRKAETVNAFVISADSQQFAIDQIALLSGIKTPSVPSSTNVHISIEQLTSIIAQQLQPLQQELGRVVTELAAHKQILASFNSQVSKSAERSSEPQIAEIEIVSPTPKKPSTKSKSTTKKQVEVAANQQPQIEPLANKADEQTVSATSKKTNTKNTKSISKVELDPSINPVKAANALNLINTLSASDLLLRMQKSSLTASTIKFVPSIIEQRNTQPDKHFDSWESIMLSVSGFKTVAATNIINKLK